MPGKDACQAMNLRITEIQHFCTHDGPGIRTTVFLNGCPLSCKWCHNPEARLGGLRVLYTPSLCIGCRSCGFCKAHTFTPEHHFDRLLCAHCGGCAELCPSGALENTLRIMSTDQIAEEIRKDQPFYGMDGGVTLSGGEPLAQPDGALELLALCRRDGIRTAIETCGYFSADLLPQIAEVTDLLLWDLKDTDPVRHQENTGVPLQPILDNLREADRFGIPIRLRCICLEGINAAESHFRQVREIAASLTHLTGIDLLPYHPMGQSKYDRLGIPDPFDNDRYIPSPERLAALRRIACEGLTFYKQ